MPLDFSKPVQTRDGRPVKILTVEGRGSFPIVGYIGPRNEDDVIHEWDLDGEVYAGRSGCRLGEDDLVNAPVKRTGWINIYRRGEITSVGVYTSKEEAVSRAHLDTLVATIQIEWTES